MEISSIISKFEVIDKGNGLIGQPFIKEICAEDGTIFKCLAFNFSQGRVKTFIECLEGDGFKVNLKILLGRW